MQIFLYSDDPNKRYHAWSYTLRQQFGEGIFKVPIDGGFDCPNRDGTVTKGGCTFCSISGLGGMIIAPSDPLPFQFQKETRLMHQKWPTVDQYIIYLQNFTNTHALVDVIHHRLEQVVNEEGVVGLSIGTHPNCLPDEVMNYLTELNERFYLWIELDLQTTFEETSAATNRTHDYQTYPDGVAKLRKNEIRVYTHLTNGLPGETPAMMRENMRRTIQSSDIQEIRLHLLHLVTDTKMMRDYNEGCLQLMSKEAYVSVICDQLKMISPEIVIHRLTGDAPFETVIGPMWSLKKWEILDVIDVGMERRNGYQGKYTVISGKEVFN